MLPEGKVWIVVHGWKVDDLFEVDASTPEQEEADAKAQFRKRYPSQPIMKTGRIAERGDDGTAMHS